MMDVSAICDRLNDHAEQLARQLLPNGHKSGNHWMFSGIEDHGRSASAYVVLAGAGKGHWRDQGNAHPGEEKGDILDLIQLKQTGGDKAAAVSWAKGFLGIEDDFQPGARVEMSAEERARRAQEAYARQERQEAELARERVQKAGRAKALFLSGLPAAGTPVEEYLHGRAIDLPALPGSLRWHGEVWCKPLRCKAPAMLGGVFDASGAQIGCHRTYLRPAPAGGWVKIDSPNAKMMLGNKRGGFIPIAKGSSGKSMRHMAEGEPVYVTEGIEDALCVAMLKSDARVVAAIDLGNVGALILPQQALRLVLVADRDENLKAQETLERVIAQQQARGIEVQLVLPPPGIKDINDWVQDVRPASAAAAPRRQA